MTFLSLSIKNMGINYSDCTQRKSKLCNSM